MERRKVPKKAGERLDRLGLSSSSGGAATGTVGGILGVDTRPRFREYVVRERRPSYRYSEEIRVGTVLPESGVTYYEVPAEYNAPNYRYTYVNERPRAGRPPHHADC